MHQRLVWVIVTGVGLLLGLAASATAADDVLKFRSRHYQIVTDVDKKLAIDIARHMDAVYAEYARRMKGFITRSSIPMTLYVWRTYDRYLEFTQSMGFNAANSGGVFFVTRHGQGLATWVEGQSRHKMYYILQHEGFHQFAYARIGQLPIWLNEGLAEYFGDALLVDKRLMVGKLDAERLERMQKAIENRTYLPFEELMNMSDEEWLRRVTSGHETSSLMYDMSWSLAYFLIHGYDGKFRPALDAYLKRINRGVDKKQAFDEVFGPQLEPFELAWGKSFVTFEPDPWYNTARRVVFLAQGIKALHDQGVEIESFEQLERVLKRTGFQATLKERDIVARGEKKVEADDKAFALPENADVRMLPAEDDLPPGLLVRGLRPTIRLEWRIDQKGDLAYDITYN